MRKYKIHLIDKFKELYHLILRKNKKLRLAQKEFNNRQNKLLFKIYLRMKIIKEKKDKVIVKAILQQLKTLRIIVII
jgi:hypothetical protein